MNSRILEALSPFERRSNAGARPVSSNPSTGRASTHWLIATVLAAPILGMSLLPTPAVAANASDLTVTAESHPGARDATGYVASSVSVSRAGLAAYVAYRVKLVNGSTNTVNQVVFTGSTDVAGYSAFANIASASPNCGAPPAALPSSVLSVTCNVGQMKSQEVREFFLIFQTPSSGSSVNFTGQTTFSEGNSPNSPPASYTKRVDVATALTTVTSDLINSSVKTVLPTAGGLFFTGSTGKPGTGNPLTTQVTVPSSTVTDNAIDQPAKVPSYPCNSAYPTYTCFGLVSVIDVLKAVDDSHLLLSSGYITILLRQDASSFPSPIPKIGDVKIFYTPSGTTQLQLVPTCSSTIVPTENNPCVSGRRDFIKGSKGYYEYEIRAVDNGKFTV